MQKILFILTILLSSFTASASTWQTCMDKLNSAEGKSAWHMLIFDENFGVLKQEKTLSKDIFYQHKEEILAAIGAAMEMLCTENLGTLLKEAPNAEAVKLNLVYTDRTTGEEESTFIRFKPIDAMAYLPNITLGFLVTNKPALPIGTTLKRNNSNMVPQYKDHNVFHENCSDHVLANGLSNSAIMNRAGQAVFTEEPYKGSDNEFFIDFAVHDDMRAFPGLILMDENTFIGHNKESVVIYSDPAVAQNKLKDLQTTIKGIDSNKYCSGLTLYAVMLDKNQAQFFNGTGNGSISGINTTNKWLGGAFTVGLATGLATEAGFIGGGAAAAGGGAGGAATGALASSWVPVVGWVIAAGAVGYGIYKMHETRQITDNITEVTILSKPYRI